MASVEQLLSRAAVTEEGEDGADVEVGEHKERPFVVVARAVQECTAMIKPVPPHDLLLGVRLLMREDTAARARAPVDAAHVVNDPALLSTWFTWSRMALGSYCKDTPSMLVTTGVLFTNVVEADWVVKAFRPCYYIARLPSQRAVMLCIRGTASVSDALTDVAAAADPFKGGHAHRGMLKAAEWFVANLSDKLKAALADPAAEGYRLVITGHSLGAGTACLVTMMLADTFPGIHCYAFAPPAVVSDSVAVAYKDNITSFVCEFDLVPRFSLTAASDLMRRIESSDWRTKLSDEVRESELARMLRDVNESPTAAELRGRAAVLAAKTAELAGRAQAHAQKGLRSLPPSVIDKGAAVGSKLKGFGSSLATGALKGVSGARAKIDALRGGGGGGDERPDSGTAVAVAVAADGDEGAAAVAVATDEGVVTEGAPLVALYPPMQLYHILEPDTGSAVIVHAEHSHFGRIDLCRSMLADHSLNRYVQLLNSALRAASAK